MKVGVPQEIKNHEDRLAITLAGAAELLLQGLDVFVEAGTGAGPASPTPTTRPPARRSWTPRGAWGTADLVRKVKKPITAEYDAPVGAALGLPTTPMAEALTR